MLITVIVDNSFSHPAVTEKKFTLDIDASESIENLRVTCECVLLLGLNYVEIQ